MDKLHLIAKNLNGTGNPGSHEIEELLKYGHILEKGEVPPQEETEKPADGTPAPVGPCPQKNRPKPRSWHRYQRGAGGVRSLPPGGRLGHGL